MLSINQPIEREIVAGTAHAYTILLNAGDYVAGSVDQRGIAVLAVAVLPDGSRFRGFPGPPTGKRPFAFIAETPGLYRLELRAPTQAEAAQNGGQQAAKGSYEVRVIEKLSSDDRLKPGPRPDKFASPTIVQLRTQLAGGQRQTEAFWRQAAQSGTPLIEPLDKDRQHTLVTFIWRGTPETHNVVVFGSFATRPLTEYAMTQVGSSDVWYLTLRLPSGARFAYSLSPNDPLSDGPQAWAQRLATFQGDPLNPHRWGCGPAASRYECQSMVELPDAPPQPWIIRNAETPTGKVDKHVIKSDLLKNERNLSVYTPPNYRPDGTPYALLLVFDEGAYLSNVPTPVILDNLIAASKIPPTVAVLIANPSQEARSKELPPNPVFAEFLAQELMPWVHAHYHVTRDPRQTVVAGSSFGGIAATYAGLRHHEVFGNIVILA